ncbi:MAG: hypothetical protein ACRD3Q_16715, partial [Terriglobales bacterium]
SRDPKAGPDESLWHQLHRSALSSNVHDNPPCVSRVCPFAPPVHGSLQNSSRPLAIRVNMPTSPRSREDISLSVPLTDCPNAVLKKF